MEEIKRTVYADNAATTQISEPVLAAMLPWLRDGYGNPSSIYTKGREAHVAVENAREQLAKALNAKPPEIFFTSCGSESDNWAIKGAAYAMGAKGKKHIISTVFEHHAILHTCKALEKQGFSVTLLPVDAEGIVSAKDVADAIREDTALVSIMYANNEIGTVQPIADIGRICRDKGVLFHTDAVQAVGAVEIDVEAQCIDMLSLSGHKLHAPKGVGALYIRKGITPIPNLIEGGGQERGRRAGTENVASIVGLGAAIEIACRDIAYTDKTVREMSNRLMDGILTMPHTRLNGHRIKRLPGNTNISFEGVEGESLLLMLDSKGISASSGSACTSGSLDPSHVLLALGMKHEVAHGSLRLSITDQTTRADIDYMLAVIPPVVERLRAMSPLWEQIIERDKQNKSYSA